MADRNICPTLFLLYHQPEQLLSNSENHGFHGWTRMGNTDNKVSPIPFTDIIRKSSRKPDAGGIKAISRWLRRGATTPPEKNPKNSGIPAGMRASGANGSIVPDSQPFAAIRVPSFLRCPNPDDASNPWVGQSAQNGFQRDLLPPPRRLARSRRVRRRSPSIPRRGHRD